ncbi:MAG: hypothetical protein KME25_30985 [Symplocastrum torsivum CPER-KK1]|uniref:Uncharacterized protein n=1 Tax=Symplocastrum torsivum CPER-KK1 TaxID=450513 RepID=A0A951PRW3_9CYAN|nr:hypothetical protein [Symplocastrum torsivum CPER-KK1]
MNLPILSKSGYTFRQMDKKGLLLSYLEIEGLRLKFQGFTASNGYRVNEKIRLKDCGNLCS